MDVVNLFRFSGLRVQQLQIPLQAVQLWGRNISINFCQLCRKLLGNKGGIVVVEEFTAVTLVDGINNLSQFCRDFIQPGFFSFECIVIFSQQCSLHQIKGNHTAYPAALHLFFLVTFLFDDHVGVNLLGGCKSFGLNDFEIGGDTRPLIVQQLIRLVFVQQRQGRNAAKDILCDTVLCLGDI